MDAIERPLIITGAWFTRKIRQLALPDGAIRGAHRPTLRRGLVGLTLPQARMVRDGHAEVGGDTARGLTLLIPALELEIPLDCVPDAVARAAATAYAATVWRGLPDSGRVALVALVQVGTSGPVEAYEMLVRRGLATRGPAGPNSLDALRYIRTRWGALVAFAGQSKRPRKAAD